MNNEPILVSVVMITFNQEKYIREAIESVLSQERNFDIELLIGDDASTDSTPQIIREYKNKYPNTIKCILRNKNVGGTRNSYKLFVESKGKYIAILEGDDYWTDKRKLQKQVDYMEKHTQYSGCCTDFAYIDADGAPYPEFGAGLLKGNLYCEKSIYTIEDFNNSKLPGHAGTVLFRNFFKAGKDGRVIYKAHRMIGDFTVILLILSEGNIARLPEKTENYRINKKGSSWTAAEEGNPFLGHDTFMYYTYLENYASEKLCMNVNLKNIKARFFFDACKQYYKSYTFARMNSIVDMLRNTNNKGYYLRILMESPYYAKIPTTILDGLESGEYKEDIYRNWNDFKKAVKDKNLVLAGAGAGLGNFLEEYYLTFRADFIVDNNLLLHGKFCYGYKIFPLKKLSDLNPQKTIVLITTNDNYIKNLKEECISLNVPEENIFSYVHLECNKKKYDYYRMTQKSKLYLRNF